MLRFLFLLIALTAAPAGAAPIVAAAASLRYALDDAAIAYGKAGHVPPRITYGASGSLVQQIRQGAPYELFLSADAEHVDLLAKEGRTSGPGTVYAVGRLALVAGPQSKLQVDAGLEGLRRGLADGSVQRMAIANPAIAPYGARSVEALRHAGLWQAVQPRLVIGENIGQAFQFATTGGADGGFVSLSLLGAPGFRGRYALVPESWHAPLLQKMVLLKGADAGTRRFHDWLLSPAGQAVLARHGYRRPR